MLLFKLLLIYLTTSGHSKDHQGMLESGALASILDIAVRYDYHLFFYLFIYIFYLFVYLHISVLSYVHLFLLSCMLYDYSYRLNVW